MFLLLFSTCFTFLISPAHFSGRYLSVLPVDPKLGKMLIYGAVFHCLDPILTVVSGLSVKDPFLLPQDKKDVSSYIFSSGFFFGVYSWMAIKTIISYDSYK